MATNQSLIVVLILVGAVVTIAPLTAAKDFIVGDDRGWTIQYNYTIWAEGKEFRVGDTLAFNYRAGAHDVSKVDLESFRACTVAPNATIVETGNDVISLDSPGRKWYLCGKAGHFDAGQKLAITVLSGSDQGSAPSPTAPPASSASTTPLTATSGCWMAAAAAAAVMTSALV